MSFLDALQPVRLDRLAQGLVGNTVLLARSPAVMTEALKKDDEQAT